MLDRARQTSRDVVDLVEEARRRRTGDLVLELDLTEPLVDSVPHDPVSAVLARRRTSLRAVLDGLRRAGTDPRVRALVVKVGGSRSPLALARAQELRGAVEELRRHGKLTVAWAETFGELDRGSAAYYVASGCDQVWLQPSGDVCLTGVAVKVPFLRDALDKAGVTAQVAQRHEYKSAANLVTERAFTPAHREATERLVASLTDQIIAGVAAGRRLDAGQVRELVDRAPLFADEALDAGLVDRLGYRDEVYAAVRDEVGASSVLCFVDRYARSAARARPRRGDRLPHIAVVDVTGTIHLGRSGRRPLGGMTAGAATVCAALRAAAADRDVAAVVLRVDSRGGSYVASDAIWREVVVTREAGTPIVASMGDVAASGGYFVAMGADAIVAEPATLTGSIGVVAGKGVVEGLADRLGIGHESVAGARHGLMFSPLRPFSDDEWARLNAWLDRIYGDFTAKVAAGRGLPPDRVEDVARGRVWTGADAHGHGLVDELGGLALAAEVARVRAGLPADPAPDLVAYPRLPLVTRMRRPRSSEDPAAAGAATAWDGWGDLAGLAAQLGLPVEGPLTLPADWLPA